jgi:hypothetical protein
MPHPSTFLRSSPGRLPFCNSLANGRNEYSNRHGMNRDYQSLQPTPPPIVPIIYTYTLKPLSVCAMTDKRFHRGSVVTQIRGSLNAFRDVAVVSLSASALTGIFFCFGRHGSRNFLTIGLSFYDNLFPSNGIDNRLVVLMVCYLRVGCHSVIVLQMDAMNTRTGMV